MKILLTLVLVCLAITSCKTTDQIRREQMVDQMSLQVVEGQKLNAGFGMRFQELEEKVTLLTGQVEEVGHFSRTTAETQSKDLNGRLEILEKSVETLKSDLEKRLQEQDQYLQKVLKALEGLNKAPTPKKKSNSYNEAMEDYAKGRYAKAKPELESLLQGGGVKGAKKLRVIHNLGMISFMNKDYQNAMIYFSKLYSEDSKSTFNANGLFFLGKSLEHLGQKDQAKQAYDKVVKQFSGHKKATDAKKAMQAL